MSHAAPLIRLQDIHFAYPGHAPVLKGADLDLFAGERLALVGTNGAGKTTLMHIAVGLLAPSKGKVIAFGHDCHSEADFLDVRRRAGLLFQDSDDQLFCPTVVEDIAFGPLNLGKSQDEALQIANDTLSLLNLKHLKDRVTYKLSGGQKRLVALATVLAMEPDVLLLDEPTNALDASTEARLIEILLSLPQAMIIVSHNRAFVEELATVRATLDNGTVRR